MRSGLKSIIYPVRDLQGAKATFNTLLNATPLMDTPYYVGYDVDGVDVGLDPNGHAQGMSGPISYFFVADIAAAIEALTASGATPEQPVRDADGNVIGLMQAA